MSRIGKQPILIPDKVEVSIDDEVIKVKGSLGELELSTHSDLIIEKDGDTVVVSPNEKRKNPKMAALWGLYRSLVANMVKGVSEGFEKKLEIHGVGYRAEASGDELVLNLGYSHPVVMKIPEGLKVEVKKSNIAVSGIDKQKVGQFAADIRSKRKPEPYKGKGIRYEGEHVRRKAGKRAIGASG
ncbi:MAG: 50S ribosomal protein L6 [Candidatus Spechtbacterales bacterium]